MLRAAAGGIVAGAGRDHPPTSGRKPRTLVPPRTTCLRPSFLPPVGDLSVLLHSPAASRRSRLSPLAVATASTHTASTKIKTPGNEGGGAGPYQERKSRTLEEESRNGNGARPPMQEVDHGVRLEGGCVLTSNGILILDGLTPAASPSPEVLDERKGLVLSLQAEEETHAADFAIAQLCCVRFLACARNKLWWMTPEWGDTADQLPPETQFLLCELEDGTYATILPLLDNGFRGTLRPTKENGARPTQLMMRMESGDVDVRGSSWASALLVTSGADPFELVEAAVATAASLSGGGRALREKQLPANLDTFGWCTWDAFYSRVSALGIAQGLSSLHEIDVPPRFLIIDDGWQKTDVDAKFRLPPTQRAVDDAAKIVKESVHVESVDRSLGKLQRSVAGTGEDYIVAESEILAVAARKLPGGTSAGNVMPSLAGEGPKHKALHRSKGGDTDKGLITRSQDELEPPTTDTAEDAENAVMRAWSAAVNRVTGIIAGLGSAAFLKFYQYVVEPSAPDSLATRYFGMACQGFLRTTMLTFYADASDFTRRLTSVRANAKFSSPDAHPDLDWNEAEEDLQGVVRSLRERFGLNFIYCWHGLPAYWSGLMPPPAAEDEDGTHQAPEMSKYNVRLEFGRPSDSLLEIEPSLAWNPSVLAGIGVLADPAPLYRDMHSYLSSAGIDGVKVDCQAGVGLVGSTMGGGPSCAKVYHEALEASVATHFPGNHCINCMSHSTENLYHYTGTAVARASDDFYPRDPDSCTPHIAACAYNSLFLAPLVQPDWDMFHSKHEAAALHAVARAVSGGAIYVSDKPGQHDAGLLRSLVLPDGSVLRCRQPGRPTLDSLMMDTLRDGRSVLKVWNVNDVAGVVAVFNLQGASWSRERRAFRTHDASPSTLTAEIKPADVVDLAKLGAAGDGTRTGEYAVHVRGTGEVHVLNGSGSTLSLPVPARSAEMLAVVPVQSAAGVSFAPLGCPDDMINGSAAVTAWRVVSAAGRARHRLNVRGNAPLRAHCTAAPEDVQVAGVSVPFEHNAASATLRVPLPAPALVHDVVVSF